MASCPLGFGSSAANKSELSPYHCVLCRGLLHDPVITNSCRHTFCAFCVRRFRDCPTCGADIEGTSSDTALSATIQKILLGHARLISKTAGSAPTPGVCPAASTINAASPKTASCPLTHGRDTTAGAGAQEPNLDLPSVLLQLALQSLAGGNPEAALARLDMCADTLCSSPENPASAVEIEPRSKASVTETASTQMPAAAASAGAAPCVGCTGDLVDDSDPAFQRHLNTSQASAETASRLGAILGCKADCYRRLGDPVAALRHYASSLACIGLWRGRSKEADSAMSVTHNKLGDLLLILDRLVEAKAQYEAALEIRREVVRSEIGAADTNKAATASGIGLKAMAGGPTLAEEEAQDLYDLAVSLCKVADVGFTLHGEEWRPSGRRPQQNQRPLAEEVSASAAAAAPALDFETTGDERQKGQDVPLGKLAELLAEARGVLLRPELLPYARACGLAAVQPLPSQAETVASTSTEERHGGGKGTKEGGSGSGEGAAAGGGYGCSGKQGETGSKGLVPVLVSRYGKVWGVVEQLSARLKDLQLSTQ